MPATSRGSATGPAPRSSGADVPHHLVDEARIEERGGQGRTPLDERVLDVGPEQVVHQARRVAVRHEQGRGRGIENAGVRGQVPPAHHDPQGLPVPERAVGVASGQVRVVDERRPGTDHDRIDDAPHRVRVGARGQPGDVGRSPRRVRDPPIEAHRALEGHQRPPVEPDVLPRPVGMRRLVPADAPDDLDTRRPQLVLAPAGLRHGIGAREHDARHAGIDQRPRAGPGPAGMTAGLEGHDRRRAAGTRPGLGQRIDLCVRRARTAVMTPAHDHAGVIDDHAADARVRRGRDIRCQRERDRLAHVTDPCLRFAD